MNTTDRTAFWHLDTAWRQLAPPASPPRPAGAAPRLALAVAALLFAALLGLPARAQDVITPTPAVPNVPPAVEQMEKSGARTILPLDAPASLAPTWSSPSVSLYPHLLYRYVYGDGVPSAPGQAQTTSINEISPGILLGFGSRWTLDYTPTWRFYSNRAFRDSVDHSLRLAGNAVYDGWTFGLGESYLRTDSSLIETGRQTRQEVSSTDLTGLCSVNANVAVELTGGQHLRYVSNAPNSYEWTTTDWVHYQVSPQLDTSVGAGFGYVEMTHSPTMTYWQVLGRIDWRATEKVRMGLTAGGENRRFHNSGVGSLDNPIFTASITYQPADSVELDLGASRQVSPGYFAGQVDRTTSWNARLVQRLAEHYFLSVGYVQAKTSYLATEAAVLAGREDDTYAVNVRLSTVWLQRGSAAIFYQRTHNTSNSLGFGLGSNQFGAEIGYRF